MIIRSCPVAEMASEASGLEVAEMSRAGFASVDEALRWVYEKADGPRGISAQTAYRFAVGRVYSNADTSRDTWDRLADAARWLRSAGLV